MQPEQVDKLLRIGYNMLLIEVLVYVIIACIIAKYMLKQQWSDVIGLGLTLFVLWFIIVLYLSI